jgi:queuine tRNA-ribosyltransferase
MTAFSYCLEAREQNARAGTLTTPHGIVHTPVFMPVGTHSAVRTLTWAQVEETGAEIVLGNSYHLYLRPGHALVEKAGGLHGWMNWNKPILTDSGGFQVFSLAKHRDISPEGVWFKDVFDGKRHFMGPRESMAIQNALGADIIMAFDECPPGAIEYEYARESLEMTNRWLEICFEHHCRPDAQALFPIVQGGVYEDLREKSVAFVSQFPAHGFAIGGVSVGETKMQMNRVVAFTAPLMPPDKPRYLMGVGTPEDLLEGIRHGIDMFDCVMPTRVARHGSFFTPTGKRIIRNAEYKEDFAPLVEGCGCYTCQNHTRAYIRHIFRMGEATASALMSIHNIYTLVQLAQAARRHIIAGTFECFYDETTRLLGTPRGLKAAY